MQKKTLLCSAKTDTTTPGKLGRAVGFWTRASRTDVGFEIVLKLACVGIYPTVGFHIILLDSLECRAAELMAYYFHPT